MMNYLLTVRHNVKTAVMKVFRPYAKFWLSPLLQLILCDEFSGDTGDAAGINYFINDVLVTLLSWHQIAVPQVCDFSSTWIFKLSNNVQRVSENSFLF